MALLSVEMLGRFASNVLVDIDHSLLNQRVVESILETYSQFCRADESRRLNISEKSITDEMRLRLHFECVCLCVFFASAQAPKYITERKWFVKRPDRNLIELFHRELAMALRVFCTNTGMNALREITLVSIDPNPTFALGGRVDPLDRLKDYWTAYVKEAGSELKQFGKLTGKALDAPNYPVFEIIGWHLGTPLLQLSDHAMDSVFMRP